MVDSDIIKSSLNRNPITKWVDENFRKLLVKSLNSGQVPDHVAFIMDGNRRYAKNNGLKVHKGHEAGSKSLVQIIDACNQLHINHVSVYAFSIENFNRSPEEVDKLFEILLERLNIFLDHKQDYNELVQIRIIGNKSYIPSETLEKLEEIERITSVNTDLILNVCFAYTSRDEITHSIDDTIDKTLNQTITPNQINIDTLTTNFYFYTDTPPVDLLIRTSGHTRLSDFLIWQVNENTHIEFINTYWPDFKILQFYYILIKWSYNKSIEEQKSKWSQLWKILENPFYIEKTGISLKELPSPPPLVSVLGKK